MLEEMPFTEYCKWFQYLDKRPPEWRADSRAAAIVNSMGAKIKPEDLFPSLAAIRREAIAAEKKRDEEKTISSKEFFRSALFANLKAAPESWTK